MHTSLVLDLETDNTAHHCMRNLENTKLKLFPEVIGTVFCVLNLPSQSQSHEDKNTDLQTCTVIQAFQPLSVIYVII